MSIPREDWVALTIQRTLMYLLKLTFLRVETELKMREKWPLANSERKIRTFEISGKVGHLFQQIHQREKTWKMMVFSSPPNLILVVFGLLLMSCCSLTQVYFKNTKKLSQSLNRSLLIFFFPEEMSMFSFQIWVYMHRKKRAGLSTVVTRQQQSFSCHQLQIGMIQG